MIKTYKYRLFPKSSQRTSMKKILGECCELYNYMLQLNIDLYKTEKRRMSLNEMRKSIKQYKKKLNLKNTYAQVLQNVCVRLNGAYQGFFRRVKKSKKSCGFPRFKSTSRYDSFTYIQSGFSLREKDNILHLSKIGDVPIKLHRQIIGKIKQVTIKRDSLGKWFASFTVEVDKQLLEPSVKQVGLDFGCKHLITKSDGTKIDNPKFYSKNSKALKKLQSQRDVKQKGSQERKKFTKKIQHSFAKISNCRNDFLHKLTRNLINENQVICLEDLKITSLVRGNFKKINKSLLDGSFGIFKNFLTYKAEEAGRSIVLVDPSYTSQMCSGCGAIVKKSLKVRTHKCPHCKLKIDRDHNAAINILRLGLQSLAPKVPRSLT